MLFRMSNLLLGQGPNRGARPPYFSSFFRSKGSCSGFSGSHGKSRGTIADRYLRNKKVDQKVHQGGSSQCSHRIHWLALREKVEAAKRFPRPRWKTPIARLKSF